MMDPIHAFYAAKRGEVVEEDEVDDEEVEAPTTITQASREVPVAELPQSARLIAQRLEATGKWEVKAQHSVTHKAEVLYLATSKAGAKAHHDKGDIRYETQDLEHWGLGAVLVDHDSMTLVARLTATWETRKGKNAFSAAWTYDMVTGEGWAPKAGAFEEWLSVFAPKPPPKTKKKKTEREESA